MLKSLSIGDVGTDPGLWGDLGDVGLNVEAVRGCCPSGLEFAALKLSDGGPFVRSIFFPRVPESRSTIALVQSNGYPQRELPFHNVAWRWLYALNGTGVQ